MNSIKEPWSGQIGASEEEFAGLLERLEWEGRIEGLGSFLIFLVTSVVEEKASGLFLLSGFLAVDLPFFALFVADEFLTIEDV